jgi:hypothetical protein
MVQTSGGGEHVGARSRLYFPPAWRANLRQHVNCFACYCELGESTEPHQLLSEYCLVLLFHYKTRNAQDFRLEQFKPPLMLSLSRILSSFSTLKASTVRYILVSDQ